MAEAEPTNVWRASVKSGDVTVMPEAHEPGLPDEHGNLVPATFRFKAAGVTTAVVVGTTEPPDVKLHLQVHDEDGQPLKSRPFELKAAGKSVTGTSTADGIVQVTFKRAPEAQLTVEGEHGPHLFKLQLGRLEKPETPIGAQQRLQTLGYELLVTGKLDDGTKKAIAAFRKQAGLPDGSDLDDATAKTIDQEYSREMQG